MYYLYYLLLLALLASPVVVAVYADLRTRRGYGLALMALGLIGLTIYFSVAFEQAIQRTPSSEGFGIGIVLAVYFMLGCFWVLALLIGALVEAWKAGQRRWFAGLIGAALLPWLLVLVENVLDLGTWGLGVAGNIVGVISFGLVLGLPTLTILAYGVYRIVRPAQPAPRAPGDLRAVSD